MSFISSASTWRRDLIGLTLFFGLVFAFRSGTYPLFNPDEGRYAEVPREMLASHDWVTPRLNGVNYFEKPPLMYWAEAASLSLIGSNETAARAVPAFFALLGVLLTYYTARKLYGRDAGLASAIVLGSSLLYAALARVVIIDMAVSVLMSWTLFSFILAIKAPAGSQRRFLFMQLYVSAALATLAKGLIGVLLTGAVMFLWLLIFNQWKRLRPLYLPTGLFVFFIVALPWHILVSAHNATWAHRYFIYEHFQRFFSSVASRPGPWWYFIPIIAVGLFPWIGFLYPALKQALKGGWAKREANADAWFFVTWALFIFLFFSKSHSKLAPYILPVFPPLAVLIGVWLAMTKSKTNTFIKNGLIVVSIVGPLIAVGLCVAVVKPNLVRFSVEQANAIRPIALTLAALLIWGSFRIPLLAARRGTKIAVGALALMMGVFFAVVTYAAPYIKPGTKALALIVNKSARPNDRVYHYHEFFHDFTFYASRNVDIVAFKGELELEEDPIARESGRFEDEAMFRKTWNEYNRCFAIARKSDVRELFRDSTFHYHLLEQTQDHYLFSNQP
jgi:4-amino-4-deoxy-L-arabinose transferase-like glycosyltransferase